MIHDFTTKVRSDKFAEYKEELERQDKRMEDMGIKPYPHNCEPVDLYGKRVNFDMDDPTNLEETAEDIQDHYGLNSSPTEKKNLGGLASTPEEEDVEVKERKESSSSY